MHADGGLVTFIVGQAALVARRQTGRTAKRPREARASNRRGVVARIALQINRGAAGDEPYQDYPVIKHKSGMTSSRVWQRLSRDFAAQPIQ